MPSLPFSSLPTLRRLGAVLLLAAASIPAMATPLMDMRLEDLLPIVADFKQSLNLNANQQTLWSQTESKSRTLLRERQSRREHLQAATQAGLEAGKQVELRDLTGAIEAESAASAAEEKLLREWWLNVNDALNETQRAQVVQLAVEQMMRVPDNGGHGAAPRKDDGDHSRSGGRHKGGASMGGNGGSVSLPGG